MINKAKYLMSLMLAGSILFFYGCNGDDDSPPVALTLQSMMAGSVDLNAATSPTNVPPDAPITATFSTEVDPATANNSNITLTRDYDDADIPINVTASGNTVTITPTETLGPGTLYELNIGGGLESTQGQALTPISRTFTTAGSFAPAGVIAHWTFDDTAEDVVGNFDPAAEDIIDITYVDSRKPDAGKAASFNGTTSIIEVPNGDQLMAGDDFSLSFWINASSEKDGHFVMGLAAWHGFQFEIAGDWSWVKLATRYAVPGGTDAEDTWYPGNGETRDNGGWQGNTFNKDVTATGGVGQTYFIDKWAHVVCTYDSESKVGRMYINGERVREFDFNLWPDDSPKKNATGVAYDGNPAPGNKLAFGFIQSRENPIILDEWAQYATGNGHFRGLLDDIRIFNTAIDQTEVTLMYNSERP
ncbi:hypothetical protein BH23BAC1_BH23BAC1_01970 [soil metagenome]